MTSFSDAMHSRGWTIYQLGGGLTAWTRPHPHGTQFVTLDKDGNGQPVCGECHGDDIDGQYVWALWADFDNPNADPTELDVQYLSASAVLSLPA